MIGYKVDDMSEDISGVIDHCMRHVYRSESSPNCKARIHLVNGVILELYISTLSPLTLLCEVDGCVTNTRAKHASHVIVSEVGILDRFVVIHGATTGKSFDDDVFH